MVAPNCSAQKPRSQGGVQRRTKTSRHVAFSKRRRQGLFQKAQALFDYTGALVAITFSSAGKLYEFRCPYSSAAPTVDRFLADSSHDEFKSGSPQSVLSPVDERTLWCVWVLICIWVSSCKHFSLYILAIVCASAITTQHGQVYNNRRLTTGIK